MKNSTQHFIKKLQIALKVGDIKFLEFSLQDTNLVNGIPSELLDAIHTEIKIEQEKRDLRQKILYKRNRLLFQPIQDDIEFAEKYLLTHEIRFIKRYFVNNQLKYLARYTIDQLGDERITLMNAIAIRMMFWDLGLTNDDWENLLKIEHVTNENLLKVSLNLITSDQALINIWIRFGNEIPLDIIDKLGAKMRIIWARKYNSQFGFSKINETLLANIVSYSDLATKP